MELVSEIFRIVGTVAVWLFVVVIAGFVLGAIFNGLTFIGDAEFDDEWKGSDE